MNPCVTSSFSKAQSLCRDASSALERAEKGLGSLEAIEQMIEQARTLLAESNSQATLSQVSIHRSEQLREECSALEVGVKRAKARLQRQAMLAEQRNKLLGAGMSSNLKRDQDNVSLLSKEEQSLRHTRNKVRALTEESAAVLGALRGQGARLAGSNTKLESFMESLGVSNQTILHIARTNRVDAVIVYVGCSLLVMLMIYLTFV